MGKIHLLDEQLINKIAAGEVIERPASVVKELLENAIDAEATQILIELQDGGKSLIRITDNGSGMEKDDAPLALQRHATSKLKSGADLFGIKTLGFRGEALASIAAVSKLTLHSKPCTQEVGIAIHTEGGVLDPIKEIACPHGTMIEVQDLFYNVPVRKKYLKTTSTEFRLTLDTVIKYALIHPEIHIKLTHNNNVILNAPQSEEQLDHIASIYGTTMLKDLIPVTFHKGQIYIAGYISKPNHHRADRNLQTIYVNKRSVKNPLINKAVYEAYHTRLMVNAHPILILNILIDPFLIDVNVHPQKMFVKVEQEHELFSTVYVAIKQALEAQGDIAIAQESIPQEYQARLNVQDAQVVYETQQTFASPSEYRGEEEGQIPSSLPAAAQAPTIRLFGKIKNTFYLAEHADGLLIIDQHAAHERVMYETFLAQWKRKEINVQELLTPQLFELTPQESALLEEHGDFLKSLGFTIELFGKHAFLLRTIPTVLGKQLTKDVLFAIIPELDQSSETNKVEEIREAKIIKASCKAAVKAYQPIEIDEMLKIMRDLQGLENPYTCPHGRPTMIKYSFYDLEKLFKRIV